MRKDMDDLGIANISRWTGSDQFVDAGVLLAPSITVLMSPDAKVAKTIGGTLRDR